MVLDAVSNFVRGTADAEVGTEDTTVSVDDASIFPDPATDGEFNVVIWDVNNFPRPDQDGDVEIMRVTERDTTDDELTVTRGQEMTSAASHPEGSAIHLSPTAKMFSDIESTFGDFWDAGTQELTADVNNTNTTTETLKAERVNSKLTLQSPTVSELNNSIETVSADGLGLVEFDTLSEDIDGEPIEMKDNVWLRGCGTGTTVIKIHDDAPDGQVVVNIDDVSNVKISDLSVNGNSGRTETETDTTEDIIDIGRSNEATDIRVENVHVFDAIGEAFDLDFCDRVFMSNVSAKNIGGNGIHIGDSEAKNVTLKNFHLVDASDRDAMLRVEGEGHRIANGVVVGDWRCVAFGESDNLTKDISMSNVFAESDSREAIRFYDADGDPIDVSVANSTFRSEPSEAVQVDDGVNGNIRFDNCRFERPSGAPTAFRVEGDVDMIVGDSDIVGGSHGMIWDASGVLKLNNCHIKEGTSTSIDARAGNVVITGNELEETLNMDVDDSVLVGNRLGDGFSDDGTGNKITANVNLS